LIGFCGNSTVLTQDRSELAYNSRNLLRLHILANSDTHEDQRIKLMVRDAILAETSRLFLGVRKAGEALRLARVNQGRLLMIAARVSKREGASYEPRVEVGVFAFPAQVYPFGTLPAGEYQAVRVILGRGLGKNWWCVLFPPLCFLAPEGTRPAGPVRVRLLFLERLLQRNGQRLDFFWQGWAQFWRLPMSA